MKSLKTLLLAVMYITVFINADDIVLNLLNQKDIPLKEQVEVKCEEIPHGNSNPVQAVETPINPTLRHCILAAQEDNYESLEDFTAKKKEYLSNSTFDTRNSLQEVSDDENEIVVSYASDKVKSPYEGYITKYMDLKARTDITTDDMNYIINYWLRKNGTSYSQLKNQGQAFIDASNATGYDPIFLLSLTASEGGWDVSSLHAGKNNPYSINMTDENPTGGYVLGSTYAEGIVNGAIWIDKHFYDEGYTTLHDMIYGGKMYASAKDHWIDSINTIMDKSYKLLTNRRN